MKKGFSLSEVLITLGVISIVAALTMPSIIQKQQRKQTAVKLQKFYSVMNQALARYMAEEGIESKTFTFSSDMVNNADKSLNWYNDTIGKYITSYNKKKLWGTYYFVPLADGSGFWHRIESTGVSFVYYFTNASKAGDPEKFDGRTSFLFTMSSGRMEPYGFSTKSRNTAKSYCSNPANVGGNINKRHYCARLIQMDGWEIKDDYPWK